MFWRVIGLSSSPWDRLGLACATGEELKLRCCGVERGAAKDADVDEEDEDEEEEEGHGEAEEEEGAHKAPLTRGEDAWTRRVRKQEAMISCSNDEDEKLPSVTLD